MMTIHTFKLIISTHSDITLSVPLTHRMERVDKPEALCLLIHGGVVKNDNLVSVKHLCWPGAAGGKFEFAAFPRCHSDM